MTFAQAGTPPVGSGLAVMICSECGAVTTGIMPDSAAEAIETEAAIRHRDWHEKIDAMLGRLA